MYTHKLIHIYIYISNVYMCIGQSWTEPCKPGLGRQTGIRLALSGAPKLSKKKLLKNLFRLNIMKTQH